MIVVARILGSRFYANDYFNGGFPSERLGRFIHELGHTLGLGHGGCTEALTTDYIGSPFFSTF